MTALTGVMLTLQSTLFTDLLVNQFLIKDLVPVCCKIFLSIVMIMSIGLYVYSLYKFIDAYVFSSKFDLVTSPELLLDQACNNVPEFNAQAECMFTSKRCN